MTGPTTVTGARRELGAKLAELRDRGDFTQVRLAASVGYSRSTIANVEGGRQSVGRPFWEACDRVLAARGALVTAYGRVRELQRQRHRETASVHLSDPPEEETAAADVIRRALAEVRGPDDMPVSSLETRVVGAYERNGSRSQRSLSLTLIGGFAGSGKSEFARFLTSVTGWAVLDKDTLTRPLVERLMISIGGDANDRHTSLYLENARPYEYRCLLDAGMENIRCGVSTVLTAPFLQEFSDEEWLTRVRNGCVRHNATMSVVWVKCDTDSMRDYVAFRGAARDAWKLANWDEYLATVDED